MPVLFDLRRSMAMIRSRSLRKDAVRGESGSSHQSEIPKTTVMSPSCVASV